MYLIGNYQVLNFKAIALSITVFLSSNCKPKADKQMSATYDRLQTDKFDEFHYVVEEGLLKDQTILLFLARNLSQIEVRLIRKDSGKQIQANSFSLTSNFKKLSACLLVFTACKQSDAFFAGMGPGRPSKSNNPNKVKNFNPKIDNNNPQMLSSLLPNGGEISEQVSKSAFSSVIDALDEDPAGFMRLNDDDISQYVVKFLKQEDPKKVATEFSRLQAANLMFGKGTYGSTIFNQFYENIVFFHEKYPKISDLILRSLKNGNFEDFDNQLNGLLKEYDLSPDDFYKEFSGRLVSIFIRGQIFSHTVAAASTAAKTSVSPKLASIMHTVVDQADLLIRMSHHHLGLVERGLNYVQVDFEKIDNLGNVHLNIKDYDNFTESYLLNKIIVNPHLIID